MEGREEGRKEERKGERGGGKKEGHLYWFTVISPAPSTGTFTLLVFDKYLFRKLTTPEFYAPSSALLGLHNPYRFMGNFTYTIISNTIDMLMTPKSKSEATTLQFKNHIFSSLDITGPLNSPCPTLNILPSFPLKTNSLPVFSALINEAVICSGTLWLSRLLLFFHSFCI